jgi:steroid delta-isomerase-like uncharacterized protein
MDVEINKALYRRVLQAINQSNYTALDDLMATDLIDHNPIPGQGAGLAGFKQWMASAHTTFPDLHGTLEDLIAEKDRVVGYVTWRGTQQAEFAGVAATGKSVTFQVIHIVRIANDQIAEWWGVADIMGLVRQLTE